MTAHAHDAQSWDFGTGIHGYRWPADAPRAALLLQHGYAEYAQRFVGQHRNLVAHLTAAGVDVYAFDLRGHGRSPGRRGEVNVRYAIQDHLAARRALESQPHPIFLLGHSLGGLVTAGSVLADPQHIAGVLLSSPALLIKSNPTLRLLMQIGAALAPGLGVLPPQAPANLTRTTNIVSRFSQDPLVYHGKMPLATAATALAVSHAQWSRYPTWRAPTFVMHGLDDTFTDPRGSTLFKALIASDDKTLKLFQGGRHELLNDLTADVALQDVIDWLSARLLRSHPKG